MSDKRISDLTATTSLVNTDLIPVVDVTAEATKKITLANLRTAVAATVTVGTSNADYICDGTDDQVQINAALQAVKAAGGGMVFVKSGNYSLSDILRIPSNTSLEGAGWSTVFTYADDSINSGIGTDGALIGILTRYGVIHPEGIPDATGNNTATSNVTLRNFKLDCNRAGQTSLTTNDLYGIRGLWTTNWRIENVYVVNAHSSGIAVWPVNSSPTVPCYTVIDGCRADDNVASETITDLEGGILVSNGTGVPGRVSISNCFANGNLHGISIEDSNGGVTISNPSCCSNTGNGINLHTAVGVNIVNPFCYLNENAGIGHSSSGRWISISNPDIRYNKYGIDAQNEWTITGGFVRFNDDAGIWVQGGSHCIISSVGIFGNGAGDSPLYPYGIYFTSGGIPGQNLVIGCQIGKEYYDERTVDSQTHGIYEADQAGSDYNNYFNNTFANYNGSQTPIHYGSSNVSKARNNIGWVTEASGTGTIASGTTSVVITHGLSVTPTLDDITITGGENPTADVGTIWVDTLGATTFKVNCEVNPSTSNFTFGWKAIVL